MPSRSFEDEDNDHIDPNTQIENAINGGKNEDQKPNTYSDHDDADEEESAGFNTAIEAAFFYESTLISNLHVDPVQNNELPKF